MDSINIQARLDICTLASLARVYVEDGNILRSKSDLVWKAVEQIFSLYEEEGRERFTDVYEAIAFLRKLGLTLDTNNRTKRQIQSAMVRQTIKDDFDNKMDPLITKKSLIDSSDEEQYALMANAIKALGQEPISFEEFKKRKIDKLEQKQQEGEE